MTKKQKILKDLKTIRSCRALPVILEDGGLQTFVSLVRKCGRIPRKLKEAQVKLDLSGKVPVMELSSRYHRKHSKTTRFEIPLEQLGLNSLVAA